MKFDNIKECIEFIETRRRFRPKTDLENMTKLSQLFDNPQTDLNYIHITGTNGKGSTSLLTTNVLIEAGYNVGTFVSPYVTCFNERIQFNNEYIQDDELLKIVNLILEKENMFDNYNIDEPSFFEFCTLIAFMYFKNKKPDFVILEVGMGGSLDSTNIINPICSIITNVKMDHMHVLGNTLEEICLNKLGIVKKGIPFITLSDPQLNSIFIEKSKELNSQLILINKNDIQINNVSFKDTNFSYKFYHNICLKLLGKYQAENASIVIELVEYLNSIGYKINREALYNGLFNTSWPGRLEVVSNEPLIILDGAHNIDGITRLKEFILDIKDNNYLKVVFAVSADKEKNEMIHILEDVADEIVFTKFQYKRSDEASNLYNLSSHANKKIVDDIIDVYNEIINDQDKVIICCGSLYFISEIRQYFK